MSGLSFLARAPRRGRISGAALLTGAAISILGVFGVAPASAAGCGDSWTNAAGGSWFEGANWSTKAPPKEDEEACITAAGTYTVSMNGIADVTVKALTLGGSSGAQRLSVAGGCSLNQVLTTSAGLRIETHGALTMTNDETCPNSVTVVGPLLNAGTLTTGPSLGGQRNLQGNLTNKGTIAVNADTSFSGAKDTLANEGTIALADGATLTASNEATVTNATGTIASTGTGELLVRVGTFDQGAGSTSGEPVYVDDGAVHFTGVGAASVAVRGTSTLVGEEVAKGQKLTIQSTCGEQGNLSGGALLNNGTIVLTSADGCGNQADLLLGLSRLQNKGGTIDVENPDGGQREIEAELINEKTLSIAAGDTLRLYGAFTQSKRGTYVTGIASASSYGLLLASGAATIGGTLSLKVAPGFTGSLGQRFPVLGADLPTGTFAKVTSATIKSKVEPGLYYRPGYANVVELIVTEAKVAVAPGEAAPGSTVKLFASGYPASDVVRLSFLDAKKVKTTFASATDEPFGEFIAEVTVPSTAAQGKGTFTAQDSVTGVKATATIKVT